MTQDRRITLRDVARVTGVAVSTASRALRDDPQISVATRERVQATAEALGYVPDLAARSLTLGASRTFGLMVPDATDPIHGSVVSGFEQAAHDAGYTTIVANSLGDTDRERRAIRGFAAHRVDGMALMGCYLDNAAVRASVRPSPVVFLNTERISRGRRADLAVGCLSPDEPAGVRALVEHLLEQGCRRIAYVGFGRGAGNATRAAAVAEEVAARLADAPAPILEWRPDDRPGVAAQLREAGVDGVIGYDDRVALGLLDGFRTIGVAVPHEIAVAGFDDIAFAEISNPRLTTVVQPAAEMGAMAVGVLTAAVDTGELAPSRVLPVRLVVRESTRRLG
jgi:DNA-binding LacI/PurR family transcriptional regulator